MRFSIGLDLAKDQHWMVAITEVGEVVLDQAVGNDPASLAAGLHSLRLLGGERVIGIDVVGGLATLVCATWLAAGEQLVYVPGVAVNRARQGYRGGENKSDPRDGLVIADQVRTRRDLRALTVEDEVLVELRLLVARREDLVAEQTRRLSRLHAMLETVHPGLERALALTTKGALWLLVRYVTPRELRRAGVSRITRYLRTGRIPRATRLAALALEHATAQTIVLPGERISAALCKELAQEALASRERLRALEAEMAALLAHHPEGTLIQSLPGMGVVLASSFLAMVGDRRRFRSADALAAAAGLAPVLRQSGRTRFQRRARGGNRRLKRILWQAAHCAMLNDPVSRRYYDRKRAEGKRHRQAILALARRQVNVLWAMLRDQRPYQVQNPKAIAA